MTQYSRLRVFSCRLSAWGVLTSIAARWRQALCRQASEQYRREDRCALVASPHTRQAWCFLPCRRTLRATCWHSGEQ
jgi:hypothetical protein